VVLITVSGLSDMDWMPHSTTKFSEFNVVARGLAADADVLVLAPGHLDDLFHHALHGLVALVVDVGHQLRIPSTPRINWVRSLEPMEKPSKTSKTRRPG
jgi:hypothetical protein